MQYVDLFKYLNSKFDLDAPSVELEEAGLSVHNFNFRSDTEILERDSDLDFIASHPLFGRPDVDIKENAKFRYSLVMPQHAKSSFDKVIVMLHGLNERKWEKYLPWAASLVHQTGLPVIMFPISFHMNRAPEIWSNPRSIYPILKNKAEKEQFNYDSTTTIANYALSERLIRMPERFFTSGFQSISDVHFLIRSLQEGNHPHFEKGTHVNLFAYSIGAFLMEVLMIANPEGCLNDSRFFFFCGGSLFSGVNPTSRYIMNKTAFDVVQHFYLNDLESKKVKHGLYGDILHDHSFGHAFRAMMCPQRFSSQREKMLDYFSPNIRVVGLRNDTVIPTKEIYQTFANSFMKARKQVEELHFDYPYSHELPFDAKLTRYTPKINHAFSEFIGKASTFLA